MARKSRVNPAAIVASVAATCYLAGIYGRLSDDDGTSELENSIANQKKIALHHLDQHPDIKLVDTYSDNGYTGMNYERPGFKRMMEDLKKGRINCVIVKDISRLGRHFLQTSTLVEKTFPEMDVRLICINDNYDSAKPDADAVALTLPLKMVINDYYVKDIAKKIRTGIDAKINSGEFLPSVSSIPYGYIRNPEAGTYDIDEETAPIVRRMFQMRAEGKSLNGIAKVLNEEGIPSPGKLRYDRGITMSKRYVNSSWVRGTIRKMLCDEVYIGNRVHGKIKSDRYGKEKTKRSREEWQIVENAHPAIISKELFDAVQKVAQAEAEKRENFQPMEPPSVDYRDLFRGKVFCADCGSMMSANKGTARDRPNVPNWIFYQCNNYRYSSKTKCSKHYVRQDDIMAVITRLLNQQMMLAVNVKTMATRIQNMPSVKAFIENASTRYYSAVTKRRYIEGRLKRLLVDLTERLIDRSEYEEFKRNYEEELAHWVEEEAKALSDQNALNGALASSGVWLGAINRYANQLTVDRELIDLLIERIEVRSDRSIKVHLSYADPFKELKYFLHLAGVEQDAV